MKKLIVLVVLIMALTLVLGACGGDQTNTPVEQVEKTDLIDEIVEEPIDALEEIQASDDKSLSNPFSNINNMEEYYYEVETVLEDELIYTTKFWVSGNRSRMESYYPETGESVIMIIDGEEEVTYMHMPSENMLMIMDYTSGPSAVTPDEEGNIDYIDAMKELSDNEDVQIEKGTFQDEPVQIITGDIMGNKNIIWVSTETGFPLKSEYYEDGMLSATSLFKAFNDKPVDNSLFDAPEAEQVMDLRQKSQ